VEGEVHCDHAVAVGEPARVRASIEADSVVIAGEVKGDIAARSKITLERTARVTGDLCTPGIVIQEGAKLEGRIMIGSDEKSGARTPAGRPAERASASEGTRPAGRSPLPPAPGASPPARG
jgi:cytoskeletal protein CcmA (bactofilin family)